MDKEIIGRNAAYGVVIGYLLGKDVGAAIGVIVGPIVDVLLYKFKRWLKGVKIERELHKAFGDD
jgi:uncharacterized protein YqgC (DUF456 family)